MFFRVQTLKSNLEKLKKKKKKPQNKKKKNNRLIEVGWTPFGFVFHVDIGSRFVHI